MPHARLNAPCGASLLRYERARYSRGDTNAAILYLRRLNPANCVPPSNFASRLREKTRGCAEPLPRGEACCGCDALRRARRCRLSSRARVARLQQIEAYAIGNVRVAASVRLFISQSRERALVEHEDCCRRDAAERERCCGRAQSFETTDGCVVAEIATTARDDDGIAV